MRPLIARRVKMLDVAVALAVLLALGGCWSDDGVSGATEESPGATEPVAQLVRSGPDVRYVSPDGRDDGPGTRSAPWRTLTHALPLMYAGQVLYVRDGEYREDLRHLLLHHGQPDDRILVQAYPGERPVVRGLVWLRQPSYWTIDGLDVTWDGSLVDPPLHMVKVTGGVGWSWRNSEIWGAVGAGNVLVAGLDRDEPADWSFVGNCVHSLRVAAGVNRGSNMTVGDMGAAGPGTVERNVLFDVQTGRNLTFGYLRDGTSGGPTDVSVRFNTLYDSVFAVTLAGDTTDVRLERNIFGAVRSGTVVRARRLRGEGVKVRQNLGVGAKRFFLDGQTGSLSPNRAGNILVDSIDLDDATSCHGFNSSDSVTLPYGKDAIG